MSARFKFNHPLPRLLGVEAITLYPYVFCASLESATDPRTIRHELVHVGQVKEFGWLRFYLSYLLYYAAERVKGENHYSAYWNIPYEIEARAGEAGA